MRTTGLPRQFPLDLFRPPETNFAGSGCDYNMGGGGKIPYVHAFDSTVSVVQAWLTQRT